LYRQAKQAIMIAVFIVLIRLLDNSGRAALLRRRDIWAAQQRALPE